MPAFTQTQLEAMGLKDLQAAFLTATGSPTKAPNRKYLIKSILDAQPSEADRTAELVVASEPEESPFAGMTAAQIIEAAKAKGRAAVQKAKAEESTPEPKKESKRVSDGLAAMDAPSLQALYLAEIGRPTGSDNVGYLVWKIREARKGKIKVGPATPRAPKSDVPVKIIPVRIAVTALEELDRLAEAAGTSRNEAILNALSSWALASGHETLRERLHIASNGSPR